MTSEQHTRSQYKAVLTIIAVLLCIQINAQQRAQYSQYMFNTLVLNPAYAGADEALSVSIANRRQWGGMEGAPETFSFSSHALLHRKQVGLGLTCVSDKIGVHKNLQMNASAAYHLNLTPTSVLSFGLHGGVYNTKADYLSLGGNINDPRVAGSIMSETRFDIGAGFYFRSKRLHVGLSVPEFLPDKWTISDSVSLTLKTTHLFAFSKYVIPVNHSIDFIPSMLVKHLQGIPLSIDVNAGVLIHKVLFTGISYRKAESIAFLLRAGITPQLNIGYSYDIVTGKAAALSNASHEFTLHYLFKFSRHNITSPR